MTEQTKRRIVGFCLFVAGLWAFFLNASFAGGAFWLNVAAGVLTGAGLALVVLPNLMRPRS